MKNIERENDTDFSINLITKTLKNLNLKYEINKFYTKNTNLYTTLILSENTISCGKGLENQSLASGLFEFLEHYIIENYSKFDSYQPISNKLLELFNNENFINLLKNIENNKKFKSLEFKEINGENSFFLPLFLSFPNYIDEDIENEDFDEAIQYVSNNGISIGVNKNEALLHSLCELIERNSLSHHYIDTFIMNKPYTKIKKNSISSHLLKIIEIIEEEINSELEIIKLKNQFNLYTYLVYPKNKEIRKFFKGSGCSISSEYALERSILECLQSFQVFTLDEQNEINYKESIYKEYKLNNYLKILNLDYGNNFKEIDFEKNIINFSSLKEILDQIISTINEKGYKIFIKELFNKNNIVCLKVIIPNFEKFHLVAEGIAVLPNKENFRKIKEHKND